jgi:choline dehydrogenase-like flavoprotein
MSDRFDAIVIGSGAGGAAAAYRLVMGGLRVALVEKGGHLPIDGSTLDIQRVVHRGEFLSREPWIDGRGRALRPEEHFNVGGKTKWYGAALLRFSDAEFGADLAHGCAGWPITGAELAPYYDEAERLLGVRHFDCEPDLAHILRGLSRHSPDWRAQAMPLGLAADIAMTRAEAMHFDGFASVRGVKAEAEQSLIAALRPRANFTLLARSEVTQLLGVGSTVTGVRLRNGRELSAPRVFLAAGALHSPRLLMRYLDGGGLELPAVRNIGRHLKLHLLTAMVALSPSRKTDLLRKTVVLTNDRFPHSSVQPLGFDGELISTLVPTWVPAPIRRFVGDRAYGFFLQTEDGSVAANRVRDADVPMLDYDEARLPEAAMEHRRFTRAFQVALGKAGLVSFTRRIGLNGTAHACGTLRCGLDAADSVVDAYGRVYGLHGLYVVDGSVLPRSSRVNPSLTIYAWGLRIGDLVARQVARERLEQREVAHAL